MAFPIHFIAITVGALKLACVLVSGLVLIQDVQKLVVRERLTRNDDKSVIYFLSLSIHRLSFHKLSKYPGPWLNAVSPVPLCLALISGRQHAYLRNLHTKYGPVVRSAPNDLSFANGTAWEGIHSVRLNLEKAPVIVKSFAAAKGSVDMTAAPAVDHARVRKAWAYPFSGTALLDQERLMMKHIDGFVEAMRRFARHQEAFDLPTWFGLTTFDIIGELAFAEPFGCLTGAAGSEWADAVSKIGQTIAYQQATRRLAGADTWMQRKLVDWLLPRSTSESRYLHFNNSKKKTLARIADAQREHEDFLYYVLKNAEKTFLSEDEILANASLMIGAGSDATGIAISGWMNLMLRHKTAYGNLTMEIRDSFKSESDISWARTKDLPYLGACINEAMRLHTPVPFPLMRWTPREGCNIGGDWVPGDTSISVATWASTHSELNFKDPDKFVPERWLEASIGQGHYSKDNRAASQPFGFGPRGCLGRNLSMMEQRLIICRLLWNFDVEFEGGEAGAWQWDPTGDFKNMKAFAVWKKPPLLVRLKEVHR